jgi:hypothetical protein
MSKETKLVLLGGQETLSKPKSEESKSDATATFYTKDGRKMILMMQLGEIVDLEGNTHKVPKFRLGESV